MESKFHFTVNPQSNLLKYQQLIDSINEAISRNLLRVGDMLPSVNQICNESSLSRDTVFKAYAELKNRGIVESVPNRGYFVAKAVTKYSCSSILSRLTKRFCTVRFSIACLNLLPLIFIFTTTTSTISRKL